MKLWCQSQAIHIVLNTRSYRFNKTHNCTHILALIYPNLPITRNNFYQKGLSVEKNLYKIYTAIKCNLNRLKLFQSYKRIKNASYLEASRYLRIKQYINRNTHTNIV